VRGARQQSGGDRLTEARRGGDAGELGREDDGQARGQLETLHTMDAGKLDLRASCAQLCQDALQERQVRVRLRQRIPARP